MAEGKGRRATEMLGQLRGVRWRWRDSAPEEVKANPGMGVIAQEVEQVFPELVSVGEDGYKRVDYHGLVAPLIEAVKELDGRLREVEQELQRLRARQPPDA
jgi:hypothetical protein